MMQAFDPYHKWLGIPPEEQPPNHYRLLGIAVFEDDPDVIEAAADQRMMHLRSYQVGQRGTLSQKLLNEVAAAKICLLSPQNKAAYDATLRANLSVAVPQRPVVIDPALVDLFQTVAPVTGSSKGRAAGNRMSLITAALVAVVALGGLLVLWAGAIKTRPNLDSEKPAAVVRDRDVNPERPPNPVAAQDALSKPEEQVLVARDSSNLSYARSTEPSSFPVTSMDDGHMEDGISNESEATEFDVSSSDAAEVSGKIAMGNRESRDLPSDASAPGLEAQPQASPDLSETKPEERRVQVPDDEPMVERRSTRAAAKGAWINLFLGLDPKRHSIDGEWKVEQGSLEQTQSYGRILLPLVVDRDYDMELLFTRNSGDEGIFVVLPVGEAACNLILNGWNGTASGLECIDFEHANANPTTTAPAPIATGHQHQVNIQVRNERSVARIEVHFDGKPYLHWSGDAGLLHPAIGVPEPYRIGLGTYESTTFHFARIRPVGRKRKYGVTPSGRVDPADLPLLGIEIVKASYGSGGNQRDVTGLLTWLLRRDPFMPIQADHSLTGDPCRGWRKRLAVVYRQGTEQKSIALQEWDVGTIPALPAQGLIVPRASRKFRILAARYGAGLRWADVTSIVRDLVTDPTQPFEFGIDQAGRDPCKGSKKSVVIWFDDHGKRFVRVFGEGKCVLLP